MNLKTLFLPDNVSTDNSANHHVVVYRHVRQSRLIFESGFVLGMNASIVLFLAQSLSLPIPQMRCINAQLPELASPHPLSHWRQPACRQALVHLLARSQLHSHKGTSSSRLLALYKLNWIMSAPLADINFLLLAKLGLPELGKGGRVQPHIWSPFAHFMQCGRSRHVKNSSNTSRITLLCVGSGVYCCQS